MHGGHHNEKMLPKSYVIVIQWFKGEVGTHRSTCSGEETLKANISNAFGNSSHTL